MEVGYTVLSPCFAVLGQFTECSVSVQIINTDNHILQDSLQAKVCIRECVQAGRLPVSLCC